MCILGNLLLQYLFLSCVVSIYLSTSHPYLPPAWIFICSPKNTPWTCDSCPDGRIRHRGSQLPGSHDNFWRLELNGQQTLEVCFMHFSTIANETGPAGGAGCGTTHCFARTAGGHIYGWGSNSKGELGFAGTVALLLARLATTDPTCTIAVLI